MLLLSTIPEEAKEYIRKGVSKTSSSKKEVAIVGCELKNGKTKILRSSGTSSGVNTKTCPKGSKQFFDWHSHPNDEKMEGLGLTPSPADIISNINDSYRYKRKVVSCIASPKSKNIHCFYPKKVPDIKHVKKYKQDYYDGGFASGIYQDDSNDREKQLKHIAHKFDSMAAQDFNHEWYKKSDFSVTKDTKEITTDALGTRWSKGAGIHRRAVPRISRAQFCTDIIQGYNKPDSKKVASDCKKRMKGKLPYILSLF